jgi:hypothetical protein
MMTLAPPAITPFQVAPEAAKKRWSTPRRLRVFLALALIFASLLFVVGELTLNHARTALRTIGHDTAPNIIAAQEIGAQLANLDAEAANYLLASADDRDAAAQLFELRRAAATRRIVDAANNVSFGDSERIPILLILENMGRYLQLVAQCRWRYDHGDRAGALDVYRVATDLMHAHLLPAADALDHANRSMMDSIYDERTRATGGAEVLATTTGGALVFFLLWAQLFLLRRTRRVFNPALVAATILAFAFTVFLVGRFGEARRDLRNAKDEAFESIHILWRARAAAYDANGDASRFLLDPQRAGQFESAFRTKVAVLTSRPTGIIKLDDVTSGRATGYFADEVHNVTFAGEQEAADAMMLAFASYHAVDTKMRSLEKAGKHGDAIELATGSRPDESSAAFDRFDEAVLRTIRINQDEFDAVIASGDRGLKRAEIVDPTLAILIALLAWLGIRPRLREYRAQ